MHFLDFKMSESGIKLGQTIFYTINGIVGIYRLMSISHDYGVDDESIDFLFAKLA